MTPAANQRLHVLTLEDLASPTGQQSRLVNLLPELAQYFDLVLVGRPGRLPAQLTETFVERIELPVPAGVRPMRYFLNPAGVARWRRLARALAQLPLKNESLYCDSLILAALASASHPRLLAAEVNGIANEEMAHKLGPAGGVLQGWLKTREQRGLLACDRVIAVSEGISKYLRQLAPETADRIAVIGNGVDPRFFRLGLDASAIRLRLELGDDPVAVMHSTFRKWHGIDQLLETWAIVVREIPSARLLLIGDGPGLEKARAAAARLDLGDNVVFPGAIEAAEIPRWLAAADIGVYFPEPWFIGHPIKYVEFMAVGLPVVTINNRALAGTVADADSGELVESEPEPFARAILDLFADPVRRVALGRNGAAFVATHFTWSRIGEKIAKEIMHA